MSDSNPFDPSASEPQPDPVELSTRIAVPTSRVGMWRKAADHAGIDFDEWVLRMLDRAATEILLLEYDEHPIEVPA